MGMRLLSMSRKKTRKKYFLPAAAQHCSPRCFRCRLCNIDAARQADEETERDRTDQVGNGDEKCESHSNDQ